MRTKLTLNRRKFVTNLLYIGGLAPFSRPPWSWQSFDEKLNPESLSFKLAALLTHKTSTQIIGREYLRITPDEAKAKRLTNLITSELPEINSHIDNADAEELRQLLQHRIQGDFEEENIVKLQGWLISVTEARLAALSLLIS